MGDGARDRLLGMSNGNAPITLCPICKSELPIGSSNLDGCENSHKFQVTGPLRSGPVRWILRAECSWLARGSGANERK